MIALLMTLRRQWWAFPLWLAAVVAVVGIAATVSLAPNAGPPNTFHFDKIVHAGGYGGLALLLSWQLPRWLCVGTVFALGGVLELLQGNIPGREASLGDALSGAVGAAIVLAVFTVLARVWVRRAGDAEAGEEAESNP